MGQFKRAIPILIIANLIFFAITYGIPGMIDPMFKRFALYYPGNSNFGFWQFFTNMFMHGGFTHILFNMYALWAFGTPLEMLWGKGRFFIFYFVAGVGASIIYTLANYYQFNTLYDAIMAQGVSAGDVQAFLAMTREQAVSFLNSGNYAGSSFANIPREDMVSFYMLFSVPAVGASGAIYGVLVAFGVLFPNSKLMLLFFPFPIAAKYFIPVLIAIDLFSGITGFSIFGQNVAHFGHVGGAIIGFLLMWYYRQHFRRPRQPLSRETPPPGPDSVT